MSDETRQTSNGRRLGLIAGAALVCGIAAGGAVLYVSETGSGNEVAAGSCPADDAIYAAIDGAAGGEVAAVQALDEPFDISAMAFEDGNGQPASLKDFAGKTLLVNLWATWCVPCREEMPALDALEQQEGGADFAVVPINIDTGSVEKPKKFYAETKLTSLPLFRDETMGVFDDLKSRGLAYGLPVSVLVGPDGCARAAINGPAEWASPDAVKLIEAVKESAPTV